MHISIFIIAIALLAFIIVTYCVAQFLLRLLLHGHAATNSWLGRHTNSLAFVSAAAGSVATILALLQPIANAMVESDSLIKEIKNLNQGDSNPQAKDGGTTIFANAERIGQDVVITAGIKYNADAFCTDISIAGYAAGIYRLENVPGGVRLVENVQSCLEKFLSTNSGHELSVDIDLFGQADALNATGKIYSGDLGTISNLQFRDWSTGLNKNISLIPGVTPLENQMYAVLRAYDILERFRQCPEYCPTRYHLCANVSTDKGGIHRKVLIRIIVKNALKKNYEQYNEFQRTVFDLATQDG